MRGLPRPLMRRAVCVGYFSYRFFGFYRVANPYPRICPNRGNSLHNVERDMFVRSPCSTARSSDSYRPSVRLNTTLFSSSTVKYAPCIEAVKTLIHRDTKRPSCRGRVSTPKDGYHHALHDG